MADSQSSLKRICEAIMFENWLRFYFISEEENDTLYIRLPEKAMAALKTKYPELSVLAERLNNEEITHQTSLEAVCLYAATKIDPSADAEEKMAELFNSREFQLELQLFGSWVQAYEEKLDAVFMEFTEWQLKYNQWRNSEEVRTYIAKLDMNAVEQEPGNIH